MDEGTPAVFEEVLHPRKRMHPKNERWSPKILIQFWWAKTKTWDISEMQWLAEINVTGESTRWSSWMTHVNRSTIDVSHRMIENHKLMVLPDNPMTFIVTKVAKSLGRKLTITGRFLLFCGAKCQGSWFFGGESNLIHMGHGCQNGHFEGVFPTKKSLSFLSYCWWLKSCTSWYGKFPIIHEVLYIPGGAGVNPSWGLHPRLPQ